MARPRAPRPIRPSERPPSAAQPLRLEAMAAKVRRRIANLHRQIDANRASRGLLPWGAFDRYPEPPAGP